MAAGDSVPGGTEPLVSIRGVNHTFGSTRVLFNIDLDVLPGELVILAGISGCGKTTLLTLIGGLRTLQEPSSIAIWNPRAGDYNNLLGMGEKQLVDLRKRIGFIFQRHNLFDSLTAAQNVKMSQQLQPEDPTRRQAQNEAVRDLGLSPHKRIQPLPEAADPGKLARVLELGGRVQPAALVLPATADVAFETLLNRQGWRLGPLVLPLPRPDSPLVRERLARHGVTFNDQDGTLTLLPGSPECVSMALHELGLRYGGRRLPLLGNHLEERLAPLLAQGGGQQATIDPPQLLLPAPPEDEVDEILAELGLRLIEQSLRLPTTVPEPVTKLLEQLGLRFNQGTLALPPGTDAEVLEHLPGLTFHPDGKLLRIGSEGSVFAINLLRSLGVAADVYRDGENPFYAISLPRNTPAEAVSGLQEIWKDLKIVSTQRDRVHDKPARLSGGQRQRVAICRALINRPVLILADEPTAALDPERSAQVIQLLKARAILEGTTSLVVTHDVSIMRQADRIVTMVQGKIATNVVVAEETFVYDALRRCSLFAALTTEVQQKLTAELLIGVHPTQDVSPGVRERCPWFEQHPSGSDIVRFQEWGDRAYLIRRGRVAVLRPEEGSEDPNAPLVHIVDLGPGEFFGDQAVLAGRPRNATVRALTPVETYCVTAKKFAVYRDESLPFINRILGVYGPPGTPEVTPLVVPEGGQD